MTETAPDTGTPATPPATPPAPAPEPPATGDDAAAELAKWKELARKHEDRAKANAAAAKELEQVKAAAMTDQEKAVAAAITQARADVLKEVGAERVADAVKLAAAGRSIDVDALLEGVDRGRFLTDEGQPDAAAIAAWVDRVAPKPTEEPAGFPDLGQGARTSSQSTPTDPLLASVQRLAGIRR